MPTRMLRLPLKPCSEEDFKTAMPRETVVSHHDSYLLTAHIYDLGFANDIHLKANGKQSSSNKSRKC